jgi:Spy/CpxP family protein refolding chaperone
MKYIIIILALLTGTYSVIAQSSFDKELFSANMVLKYRSEIKLSDETVDRIKKIYNDHSTEFNSLRWDLDAELVSLDKYLSSSEIDEAHALSQLGKVTALENQLKHLRLGMLIKIKNTLSASQQDMLKTLRTDSDENYFGIITSINENPRVTLKVDGTDSSDGVLFIIKDKDGERRFQGSRRLNIDPENIASIEVLKDEKAIDKYGKDAKNGVVIILLKRR